MASIKQSDLNTELKGVDLRSSITPDPARDQGMIGHKIAEENKDEKQIIEALLKQDNSVQVKGDVIAIGEP